MIAIAVKHLMAAGVTGDDLLRAIEEIEAAMDTRSTAAKRQARYRERNKASQSVTDVTGDASPSPLDAPPSFPPDPQTNPPYNPPILKRAARLAENFVMPDDWIEWAETERGWDRHDAVDESASFADYWHGKAGKDAAKLDWLATWRNWVRNSRRKSSSGYPPGHSGIPI